MFLAFTQQRHSSMVAKWTQKHIRPANAHVHGIRMQCRRCYRLPHHWFPKRTTHCHSNQCLYSLQWSVSCHDYNSNHILCSFYQLGWFTGSCHRHIIATGTGNRYDLTALPHPLQHLIKRHPLFFYIGTSSIPKTADRTGAGTFHSWPHSVRTGKSLYCSCSSWYAALDTGKLASHRWAKCALLAGRTASSGRGNLLIGRSNFAGIYTWFSSQWNCPADCADDLCSRRNATWNRRFDTATYHFTRKWMDHTDRNLHAAADAISLSVFHYLPDNPERDT